MKGIVEEQIKSDFNNNPHHIRYIKDNNKLYVVFYNIDKNEIEYETQGIIEINDIKKYI